MLSTVILIVQLGHLMWLNFLSGWSHLLGSVINRVCIVSLATFLPLLRAIAKGEPSAFRLRLVFSIDLFPAAMTPDRLLSSRDESSI
jgi:hypothetical protein